MTRPWDGVVPEEDIRALEARGKPVERATVWGARPALIVVDMTRTFVDPGYPASCFETGGKQATDGTVQVLDAARRAGIPVLYTKVLQAKPGKWSAVELGSRALLGDPTGLDELLGTPAGLPDGNEIADVFGVRDGEIVIAKPKPSAFFGTPLDAFLNFLDVDSLIVTGMVTSGCVRATVIDGYMRNYPVVVPQESVADYSWFQHRTSLLDMHMKYADVTPVADVVDHLLARAAAVPA